MDELRITNSLTREKEIFKPITASYVGMYVCGPTVSGESHLGHVRTAVTFDIVFRYLKYLGYHVRYVRNITDAGHFEEEGREAVDKVSAKAQLERLEPMELVTKYTNMYHDAMDKLNVLRPSIEPTATGHIIEQINMIEELINKGFAYVVNGSVYFDVTKYAKGHDYGRLSGRKIDEMIAGTRELEAQDEKRNAADFALWKNAPPEHIMRWKSPWGEGFPGWHIECSAMATKYLGAPFDIHGGGMDLLFPHHESEIAQTTVATGHAPAKYWMHSNMLTINGQKMSKSLNNTITLSQLFSGAHPLLAQPYHPMIIRFFVLQTHYRSTVDFSNEALQAAEKGFQRLMNALESLKKLQYPSGENVTESEDKQVSALIQSLHDYMNDDLNTAQTLASLFELAGKINSYVNEQLPLNSISKKTFETLQKTFPVFIQDILGLKDDTMSNEGTEMEGLMQIMIQMRKEAKERKDFATGDRIRNELLKLNIRLKDNKDGSTTWEDE